MNLFSVFNFGSLIKTFLPGQLLFFVILLYLEIFLYHTVGYQRVILYLLGKPALLAVLSIPLSIILGVISNSIVFSGLSNWILENDHTKKEQEFFDFRIRLFSWINENTFSKGRWGRQDRGRYIKYIDPRFFLLHETTLENLIYLRESYWYYMEFQLNTLVSITIAIPGIIWSFTILFCKGLIPEVALSLFIAMTILAWVVLYWLLMKAAYYNLDSHRKNELSLVAGTYYFEGIDRNSTIAD